MSSIITFAANNDLFRKRKRVYRACENCKKRRKRCTHTFDGEENDMPLTADAHPSNAGSPTQIPDRDLENLASSTRRRRKSDATARERSTSPSQFVGHSRPEALFLGQTSGTATVSHECGYWMPGDPHARSSSRNPDIDAAEDQALEQYLAIVNVDLLPPPEHLEALIKIYFEYVHPILPIVDSVRPGRRKNGKLLSPMLLQTICIVSSRHDRAKPHLVLQDGGKLMNPRDFAKKLYKSVNAALNAKLERDRTVLIQVGALLSQYVEGTEGNEVASMHLSEAIHHAHTVGMQFGRARDDERAEYFNNFYWCLWILDRLNSLMNGRPVFISDADAKIESPLNHDDSKHTPFGIYLQITVALDHIINYYRPRHDECTGWEKEFPGFEEMLGEKGHDIKPSILAFLELFYHCVAMVSHKAQPINNAIRASPSFIRQSLSSVRVMQILSDECPHDHPPLPQIPWSVSLTMCHAYRVFRQSKIPTLRSRARNDMQICCDLLHKMRIHWWTAGTMADLGKAVLKKASGGDEQEQVRRKSAASIQSAEPIPNALIEPTPSAVPTAILDASSTNGTNFANGNVIPEGSTALPDIDNDLHMPMSLNHSISPDWMNFDNAFENFDAVLGSSGADVSMELLKPFKFDECGAYDFAT